MRTFRKIIWWVNFLNGLLAIAGYVLFRGNGFLWGGLLSIVNMFLASYWISKFEEESLE